MQNAISGSYRFGFKTTQRQTGKHTYNTNMRERERDAAMIMHESAEMYLETIYLLHQRKTPVRAVDIAAEMGYSKPTISEWMVKLRDGGYVTVDDGSIELTRQGKELALKIYERHVLLTDVLQSIGVDAETAAQDACRLEHYISDTTFACLKNYYQRQTD